MSNNANVGSGWDYMLSAIINSVKAKSVCLFDDCHELQAIQKVSNIPEIRQLSSGWISTLSELNNISLQNSNEFRLIGNELYKNVKQNGMKCVNFYTRAIFTAPKDSAELGMSYANRAAALINLEYHKEAYSDCKLAKITNYPKSKLVKVLWRQACCAIKLEDLNKLTNDMIEVNELLDDLKIRHLHVDMMQKLSIEYEKLKDNATNNVTGNHTSRSAEEKTLIGKDTLEKGRFVIASEPILTDELIIREKAFAFIPVYPKFDQNPIDLHCQNCAATNIIPYPCGNCKRASYCGFSCLNEHMKIHQFECNGYKKHLWYEIGIAHLALRTMLCGIDELMKQIKHLHDTTTLSAWNELLLCVDETDFPYGSVLKLVTNFDKTNIDDFLGYVLTATMITVYLRDHTQFFQDLTRKFPKFMSNSSWEVFIGAIITRHIGQLICNGHAISDYEISNFDVFTSANCVAKGKLSMSIDSQRIFTAIFPRISMFNHSCDPNIRNRFNNTELMVYARRAIHDGDEIFNSYGPNNKLNPRQERQELLNQQYHFVCDCLLCKGNDEDYLNSHTYLYPCGADVLIFNEQKFWWRDCTGDNQPKNIICCSCSRQLKFDWLIEFRKAMEEWDCAFDNIESDDRIENAMLKAIAKYEGSCKFLKGDINSQKLDMANMVIKYIVQYLNIPSYRLTKRTDENYDKIKKICLTSLTGSEYKFGHHSLEYVSTIAALMDINAILDRFERDVINLSDFECLSDRTKAIFINYFEKHVVRGRRQQ